jgi:tetratricopeptide (TPR) repeat protein
MESDGMLRHLAYFEELAKLDESDPGWRSVSAGLVTMRLVDSWLSGHARFGADTWAISAVRGAIDEMPVTTPIQRILSAVVDLIGSAKAVEAHALCPRLMAYGQALEYDAKWSLAVDVYQTIIAHSSPVDDADLVVAAFLQLAFCHRTLGDLDDAAVAYEQASRVALAAGDLIGVLRGRLGDAKIAMARGNLPHAEVILEETIERAKSSGLDDVQARALTDRAFIAGSGKRYDQVIRFSYDALELSKSQRDRDRILTNIATGFRFLGLMDVARDAYLVLAATAQEQYIRWMSELNLMELAAAQGIELEFDKYRRDLEGADFTPQLRVTYLLHVGRGYTALGDAGIAIPYLERAIELASQHHLNQLMFEAEDALAGAKRRELRPEPQRAASVDPSVQTVIDAIHEMKATAGIV